MSLHLDSNKENIIENFSIFFHKIIESRPNHEEHTKEFTVLKKYLLEEGQDFSKANNFIKSLKEKCNSRLVFRLILLDQSKTTGTEKELSSNLDLKNFNLKKKAGTTPGITKFNQIPLKDYLIKNSIILSEDNKLCHRFSHIKEFLPDSQNFYRVLGLGVLEAYLTNETYQNRLKKIYEDTLNQIIPLSMNVYPFTPNELRATFCGYLKQLLTIQEEQPEPRKLKELLFEMCHKDPVFDVALITLTKEIILSKISGSSSMPRDFSNRIKSSDSSLINDIISLIPDALEINLIVEVVQENKIKESIYPSRNPRENPNLNIIHEKQSSYQNFHLLSFEEHDTFNDKEGKTHLRHLSSAAYEKPSKPAKAFGSDSKHQANFERTAPVQLHFESDHLYQQKTLDPSSTRPTINIGEYNAPSLRTPHSAHGHLSIRTTVDDKAVVNEAFEQKLISDSRSSKNLHTPSKPKKIISGDSSEDKLAQRSNRKNPELISSPNKSNLPVLVPLEDNQFKGTLVTPNGKQKSPLNIYATLINGRSPRSDECSYYSPTNNKNPKLLTKVLFLFNFFSNCISHQLKSIKSH